MTSVLVTGGTSSPGLILLDLLRDDAHRVHAVVRSEGPPPQYVNAAASRSYHDLAGGARPPTGAADVLLHVAGVSHAAAADRLARAWGCGAAICVSSVSATVAGIRWPSACFRGKTSCSTRRFGGGSCGPP